MLEESISRKIDEYLKIDWCGNGTSAECLIEDHPEIKSPVEKLFFAIWEISTINYSIGLNPQKKVGKYYLDFEISFLDYFVNSPIDYTSEELTKISKHLPLYGIEIDGHEFHEKTKIQAQKDKQREREIVSAGYKILRFSGSEVFNNPAHCVYDCYQAYRKDFNSFLTKIQYSKENINGLD